MNAALAALVAGVVATVAGGELGDPARIIAVGALAAAAGAVVNLALLSNRFRPLEALIDDMEKVDLTRPGANLPDSIDGQGETEEVERLELAFLRMLRRLEAERRGAASAALQAQEQERARIARDLHDEVNQSLTGLLLRLEAARDAAPPELASQLEDTKALANQAMRELLELARRLRPTALDDLGLEAALAGLVEALEGPELNAEFRVESPPAGLPEDVQLVIYRVAQEALANAIRHSGAEQIKVTLRGKPTTGPAGAGGGGADAGGAGAGGAELVVADDGHGFSFDDAEHGLGIGGMRERALLVGGRLAVESRPGHGTVVRLRI